MSVVLNGYSGATRVFYIAGDPIDQVKSPAGVTAGLQERGVDAICVPAHVKPADLAEFLSLMWRMPNVSGVLITVPHKFSALAASASATPRARSIGAANVLRRAAQGWHADMCDGEAFVAAMRAGGAQLSGARALLVGAGGAGSAIAHALVDAGVAELALHDADEPRRHALMARLRKYGSVPITAGSANPAGFGLVCNATPMGMRAEDPLPVQVDHLDAQAFVADVVTVPAMPPLIAAARARGLHTSTGNDMFAQVHALLLDFLLEQRS